MENKFINPNEYGSLLYDKKEKKYLRRVIEQGRIFRYSKCKYPYVSMCENKIKNILNVDYSLLTTSGTSALKAALIAAGIKPEDRVLISSYTFLATALAPISLGAVPIPIEIDLNTGLNVDDLMTEIKKGCKAIIVAHFQGRAFDLSKIKQIALENNIVLIEDACQAFGAKVNNEYAGTLGDIGVFSFQQFKQLSCGEGGCVITNNEQYYNRMRNYTDMGSVRDRFPTWNSKEALFGENYRMNNLNAAILYAQLEKCNKMIKRQKKSRDRIMKNIKNYKIKNIIESVDPDGDTSMNILLILKSSKLKNEAISLANEMSIELRTMWSSLYYDNELFKENHLTSKELRNKECKITKQLIDKMLVISIPPTLTKGNEKYIIKLILNLKDKKLLE